MEDKTKKDGEKAPDFTDVINPFLDDSPKDSDGDGKKEEEGKGEEGGDDEVRNTINNVIRPIQEKIEMTERKNEVDAFFQTEIGQHLKGYEKQIRAHALDKRSKGMTVEAIAHATAGKALINIGAELAKKGKTKADASSTAAKTNGGAQDGGDTPDFPDVTSMSKDEFSKLVEGVKSGRMKFNK